MRRRTPRGKRANQRTWTYGGQKLQTFQLAGDLRHGLGVYYGTINGRLVVDGHENADVVEQRLEQRVRQATERWNLGADYRRSPRPRGMYESITSGQKAWIRHVQGDTVFIRLEPQGSDGHMPRSSFKRQYRKAHGDAVMSSTRSRR